MKIRSSNERQLRKTCQYYKRLTHNPTQFGYADKIFCNSCPFTCTSRMELQQHIKVKHISIPMRKPLFRSQVLPKFHVCELCGYKSLLKSDVTRHMRTHTGERPFKCELCPYRATLPYNLDKHMSSHLCGGCDFRSGDRQMLKIHRETCLR